MSGAAPEGRLVVLSGPSGVGKTTVAERLLADAAFARAVTATTRAPREGERDGEDYFFLDPETFRAGIAEGRFLEHATVHGNLYGTPREEVERLVAAGFVCLLVIDVQGAAILREGGVDALYVFLAPPSSGELEKRLRGRQSDDPEAVAERLAEARAELARQDEYDAVVINDDLERAIGEIEGLVSRAPAVDEARGPAPTAEE